MKIVFLGIQGAGKGVLSRLLAEDLKIPLVSAGDILREEVNKNSEMNKKIKSCIDQGEEVPDEIVFSVIKKKIKKNAIIDGFPRNTNQVKLLGKVDRVIYLKVSEETAVKRLSGRIICSKCGQIYNVNTLKPKKEGVCNRCGGKLVVRKDDIPELIKKRIDWSKKDLMPVVEAYREQGVLEEVSGEGSVGDIYPNIRKLFKQ